MRRWRSYPPFLPHICSIHSVGLVGIASAAMPPSPSIAMLASSLSTAAREIELPTSRRRSRTQREATQRGKREEGRGGRYVDAISNTEEGAAAAPSNKFGMQGPLVVYSHARRQIAIFLQDVDQTGNIIPFDK